MSQTSESPIDEDQLVVPTDFWRNQPVSLALPFIGLSYVNVYRTDNGFTIYMNNRHYNDNNSVEEHEDDEEEEEEDDDIDRYDIVIKDSSGNVFWRANFENSRRAHKKQ